MAALIVLLYALIGFAVLSGAKYWNETARIWYFILFPAHSFVIEVGIPTLKFTVDKWNLIYSAMLWSFFLWLVWRFFST